MRTSAACLSALMLAAALLGAAQAADEEARSDPPVRTEADEPAPSAEVEPVRGIRYRVWLKSGRSMEGIVRAKGVFEVLDREHGYRAADEDEEGAGVRFWFPRAQDGFIFVHLSGVKRLEELGELSSDEGRSIARARVAAAHRAERERFQIRAMRAAEDAAEESAAEKPVAGGEPAAESGEPGAEKPPVAEGDGASDAASEAGRMAALLVRFPPAKWTLDTPQEIRRRKVILGLFPSDEEKAFLAVFDEWRPAYAAWLRASGDEGEAGDADEDSTARSR